MQLSIIIPVYKTEKYLSKCLQSCVKQLRKEVEIIIVNDGSPDNSQQIIDEFCCQYPNVKSVIQDNQGLSVARNRGLEIAKGEYVWFVDSDDWVEPNSVDCILKRMEETPDVISIGKVGFVDGNIDTLCPKYTGKQFLLASDNWMHGAVFYIYRKEFLNQNSFRFKPGIYHEDSELIPRLLYMASSIVRIEKPLYNVTVNPMSITRTINPKKSFDLIVVANSLWEFKQGMVKEKKLVRIFDKTISIILNNALANIVESDEKQQQLFNECLYQNKALLCVLSHSKLKYKVEYVLFQAFPKHYTQVYTWLKKLSYK